MLSGPSGVGKGTIISKVMQSYDNIKLSISATTREIREGEIEGVNYHYVSTDEFKEMIDNNEMLEYAIVYDNYYGTPKKETLDLLHCGNDVILELDTVGAMNIKNMFKDAVTIFLMPPDKETLIKRLAGRATESRHIINKRFREASKEIKKAVEYDYTVLNDDADHCAEQVINIIDNLRNKRR